MVTDYLAIANLSIMAAVVQHGRRKGTRKSQGLAANSKHFCIL